VADSLVLAKVIELLGGGVPSTLPQCAGAIFRLGRGFDLGDPQPVVSLLTELLGDGTRPAGWRTDNRTIVAPVVIAVPSTGNQPADRLALAGARELLLEAISAEEFTLVWAPDGQNGALNLVWDCFRAKASTVTHDIIAGKQLISELTVTFDALPFGRSDQLVALTFDSPVTGQTAPLAPLTVDDYSTVSTTTQAAWWTQSPATALYLNSARWHHDLSDQQSPLQYTRTLPAAIDLSALGKLTFYMGIAADAGRFRYWRRRTPVTVVVTLTDATARTLSFQSRVPMNASADPAWPVWNAVSLTIPQGRAFTYSNVTRYQITAYSEVHTWNHATELDATGYLSGLRAVPATSPKRPATVRGGTYQLYDLIGTAPAPLSVHCQMGYIEQRAVTQTFQLPGTPGTVNQYTAPPENPSWLSGDASNFDGGTTGGWTGSDGVATNATLAVSATQAHSAPNSLRLTPVTGGTSLTAASLTAANVTTQGLPCQAGDRIAVRAWVRAGSTGRNVTLGAQFFSAAGAALSVVSLGAVADTSAAWTQLNGRVTAPASSAYARMVATVATPAAGEFHYIDDAYLSYAVQATVACGAAGGGGGSTTGKQNAGGGAGGGEIAWETNLDLTPGAQHAYSIGLRGAPGSPVNNVAGSGDGTDGGDSYFTGSATQVYAHGGKHGGGAVQSYIGGGGGLGGTGSTNSHHFNGGNGSSGDYTQWEGGGGGGGAGDGGAGGNAGSGGQHNPGAGGPAGALGIAGGSGDQGYGGQATGSGYGGDATAPGGLIPGGGGAGSGSDTQTHHGSTGANGAIWVTIKSYTATSTFPALVVHKPAGRTGILATPVLSVGGGADPPDGREYQVPQIDGQNARYAGTYSVMVAAWTWDNPTAARTITVTIRQYSNSGGTSTSAQVAASVTPSAVVNGMVVLGEVTLPVADMAPDNTDSYYSVAVQSTDAADRFLDLLLLDSQGQLFSVNMPSGGFTDYWIDAPDPTALIGRVLGSNQGRGSAVSVLGNTLASGGALRLEPGDNLLCVYSPAGMPALEADYWPHWWHERLA
jgi:hypothetical protein